MKIELKPYLEQQAKWPERGRHILAQYDSDSIIVYQAYCKEIADYALSNGRFGGQFSCSRMSWIKTNFLWMMYRSGWGTKKNQEVVLAIRMSRDLFDEILEKAIPSTFIPDLYETHNDWKRDVDRSEVRLQWDPDHTPTGEKLERRAIQLGLRGTMLERYAMHPLEIIDMRSLVTEQGKNAIPERYSNLLIPCESVYIPKYYYIRRKINLDLRIKIIPEYADRVIVGTVFQSMWRWLVVPLEDLYLDLAKLEKAFRKKYPDYIHSNPENLRYGISIINQNTFQEYLRHIPDCVVSTEDLRQCMIGFLSREDDDLLDMKPFFFIDFDAKFFSSSFPEPGSFEHFVPDDWTSKYEKEIDHYIPQKEQFWIINGKDLFSV